MVLSRRVANLIFAVGQALVPALGYAGILGRTVDADYQVITTPVVPATYAFTIWSLIFLLGVVYAVDQARPSRASFDLYRRIGWLTAAAFAVNTLWSIVAQLELSLPLTGIIFLFGVVVLLPAARIAFACRERGFSPALTRLMVGLLAGWVSVAIFANWSVILEDAGLGAVPSRSVQALLFLSGAGLLAAIMTAVTRGLPYAVAVIWALVAVLIANIHTGDRLVAAAAACWIAAIGAVLVIASRYRRREPIEQRIVFP